MYKGSVLNFGFLISRQHGQALRGIFTTSPSWAKQMPSRPKPPSEDDFTEVFVKGSGPGGQKINKTSSAVQLRHIPTGIVVKVQDTRSQSQNRKLARQKLAERLDNLQKGEESRSAVVQKTKARKKSSKLKKSRRKYRALEEAKRGLGTMDQVDEADEELEASQEIKGVKQDKDG